MNRLLCMILTLSGVGWVFSCLIESGRSPRRPHLQAQTLPDDKGPDQLQLVFLPLQLWRRLLQRRDEVTRRRWGIGIGFRDDLSGSCGFAVELPVRFAIRA